MTGDDSGRGADRPPGPPELITCIDCGGRCHLVGEPPELGWQAGDLAVYRCEDCRDRWDLVVDEDDLSGF